jgi:hypothetical protein
LETKAKADYYSAREGFRVVKTEKPSGDTHVAFLAFRPKYTRTEKLPALHTAALPFWGDYRGPKK